MPLADYQAPYVQPVLSGLTARRRGFETQIILPGGDRYTFNGTFTPLRRRTSVVFTPGRGNANPAPEVESPMRTSPRVTPMPKGKMPRLGRVTIGAPTGQQAWETLLQFWADQGTEAWIQELYRYTFAVSHSVFEETMAATQAQLQAAQQAILEKSRTRTCTDEKVCEKRTRIHGYSRRRA